jgi:ATP-dependent RNA helicase DDX56/DBP9
MNSAALSVKGLTHLVIDEADLVLSYCSSKDLETIRKALPGNTIIPRKRATLGSETDKLKTMFCTDPIVLQLDEEEKDSSGVKQYIVKCGEEEKFLLIYAIFMLKLIKGKAIVFVGDIDRSYRLKLFLEQFGIRSCVLNSELPVNSRIHVVEEFNKGVYDIIIASDEQDVIDSSTRSKKGKATDEEVEEEGAETVEAETNGTTVEKGDNEEEAAKHGDDTQNDEDTLAKAPKKKRKDRRDKEYGVARGIDFKNVACVLNFDLPCSSKSYTHRIGRTARAGKTGMALFFVILKSEYRKHKPTSIQARNMMKKCLRRLGHGRKRRDRSYCRMHLI